MYYIFCRLMTQAGQCVRSVALLGANTCFSYNLAEWKCNLSSGNSEDTILNFVNPYFAFETLLDVVLLELPLEQSWT